MKHILIPVDGSDYSIKAIEAGKEMAKAFDSKVTILNVVPIEMTRIAGRGNYLYMPIVPDEIPDFSEEILAEAKKQFDGMSNSIETVSQHGNISDIIVNYAHEHDIDFIVMGSHGLGALKNRLMTGSVTTRVLHHVDKPVLVIK
jgi:nucleotide-binding universal stress UspA family protein